MRVILEWDGDQADLLDEDSGLSLVDSVICTLDHASDGATILHNNIKLTIEKE